eukprot:6199988-Pleurochrysis_carterae.AAC.5
MREVRSKWDTRAAEYYNIKINSDNPHNRPMMGIPSDVHCLRNVWDIFHDPIGCIRSKLETAIYMGFHAILRSSTGSSRLCNCR